MAAGTGMDGLVGMGFVCVGGMGCGDVGCGLVLQDADQPYSGNQKSHADRSRVVRRGGLLVYPRPHPSIPSFFVG